MSRFFVDTSDITDDFIILKGDNAHHIKNVLRIKIGDNVTICDKKQTDYLCTITKIENLQVIAKIYNKKICENEPNLKITLYQAIPKGDKIDFIIQKCIELGVYKIILVKTKNTVVKIKDIQSKLKRYNKIAEMASKQSNRGILPTIEDIIQIDQIKFEPLSDSFVCYEKASYTNLKTHIKIIKHNKVNIFVGAEGGFDEDEIDTLKKKGAICVSLGRRILRTETAGIVMLSAIMYEKEEF